MKEKTTPHVRSLIEGGSDAVKKQFIIQKIDPDSLSSRPSLTAIDPLQEDENEVTKGLVHKYENRILWKVTYKCAAHCQFCTRVRQIGSSDGDLSNDDIETGFEYLREHTEVNEVILSGGDPLFAPYIAMEILKGLLTTPSIKSIRIGTRMPVHQPSAFNKRPLKELLSLVGKYAFDRPIYILINIDHPDELTEEVLKVLSQMRRTGAILLAQTVFLKGINDNEETLFALFESLQHVGVMPYYIYRCDYVSGIEHFISSIGDEVRIMSNLRRRMSGVALPTYIVDVPGKGKIPVPLDFWHDVNLSTCTDFDGVEVQV